MFNNIVESVLNEISAEDAYKKFYSDMPKDEYSNLVSLYGKFDNIMKALLNSIKAKNNTFDDALNFIKKYKSIDNNVRIKFLQNFKNGSYEDIDDMINGLSEIETNGADTLKTIQNMGLVTLLDDENYRLTCTTTYESSHHFYGNSSWCTASDRFGRYDGWIYFLSYLFDESTGYIESEYDLLTPIEISAVLIQYTDKKANKIYQVQMYSSGEIGQACDFKDNSIDLVLPNDINDLIVSKLPELIKRQRESFKREYEYQKTKDEYVNKKRERILIQIDQLEQDLNLESREFAEKKASLVGEKVSTVLSSNLLENKEFIKNILTSDATSYDEDAEHTKEELLNYEEKLKSNGYLYVREIIFFGENYDLAAIQLVPCFGLVKDVDVWTPNGYPVLKDYLCIDDWYNNVDLRSQNAIVIAKISTSKNIKDDDEYKYRIKDDKSFEILNILKVIKNDKNNRLPEINLLKEIGKLKYIDEENDYRNNFLLISNYPIDYDDSGVTGIMKEKELFCANGFKSISLKISSRTAICYPNVIVFYGTDDDEYEPNTITIDLKTLKQQYFNSILINKSGNETNFLGYWMMSSRVKDKTGFLFCDSVVKMPLKIENISYCNATVVGSSIICQIGTQHLSFDLDSRKFSYIYTYKT